MRGAVRGETGHGHTSDLGQEPIRKAHFIPHSESSCRLCAMLAETEAQSAEVSSSTADDELDEVQQGQEDQQDQEELMWLAPPPPPPIGEGTPRCGAELFSMLFCRRGNAAIDDGPIGSGGEARARRPNTAPSTRPLVSSTHPSRTTVSHFAHAHTHVHRLQRANTTLNPAPLENE